MALRTLHHWDKMFLWARRFYYYHLSLCMRCSICLWTPNFEQVKQKKLVKCLFLSVSILVMYICLGVISFSVSFGTITLDVKNLWPVGRTTCYGGDEQERKTQSLKRRSNASHLLILFRVYKSKDSVLLMNKTRWKVLLYCICLYRVNMFPWTIRIHLFLKIRTWILLLISNHRLILDCFYCIALVDYLLLWNVHG